MHNLEQLRSGIRTQTDIRDSPLCMFIIVAIIFDLVLY